VHCMHCACSARALRVLCACSARALCTCSLRVPARALRVRVLSARPLPISSAHALHTHHALHIDLCAHALQRRNVKTIETRIEVQVKRLADVQKAKGCGAEDAAAASTLEPIELP